MVIAPLLAAAALLAPPPAFHPDVAAARAYARTRQGTIAFAVRTEDARVRVARDAHVPVGERAQGDAARRLPAPARRARPAVQRAERALLDPMIRRSDNAAASAIFAASAATRLRASPRRRGCGASRPVAADLGQLAGSTPRDQTRFFLHIDELFPARHRAYAMGLLAHDRAAPALGDRPGGLAGWRGLLQGRLGLGHGRVDHQVALLRGDVRLSPWPC